MHNLVSHFILERYAAGQMNGQIQATALFVDISGFSTITDALMVHGQHGAEVLAGVMKRVFDPLIHLVFAHRGFVAGFAGDAFTAFFPEADPLEAAPARALAAAWQMQEMMATIGVVETVYGGYTLVAKTGIAAGDLAWGIISSTNGRRASYYIRGTAIDGCAAAEHLCQGGDVVVDKAVFQAVSDDVKTEPVDGHLRVRAVTGALAQPQPVQLPPVDREIMALFFPLEIWNQDPQGEFRQVVSLFISLPTVRTEAQMEIFMQNLFALQASYGGLLSRLDFGDKGAYLLLFWGTPVAYENDIERVLDFVLDLQAQTSIPINAGITYQIVHAGFVGSDLRGEYTCYGRGINLAARFMTGAPRGEIWVDGHVARQARHQFEFDYEGEKTFKGFAQPQPVYVLLERKEARESIFQGALVGREEELAQLAEFIQPIFRGKCAGAMEVWGEPGIGKSRLVHEFWSMPLFEDQNVLWALCQSDEIMRQSLNPFRYWLRHYFGQSVEQSDARNKRNFNRKLDGLRATVTDTTLALELDRIRSFLGALVGLSWPDSLYEQVDGQGRYENTFSALTTLLFAESWLQPVVLFIEDAHWLDDDSNAYLQRLSREMTKSGSNYPIAILATARFEGAGLPLDEALQSRKIDLGALRQEDIAQLAENILENPVAPAVVDYIMKRAEGNPFFAEQIVRHLQEEGLLVQQETTWEMVREVARAALPTDVRAVLVARLDRLTQSVKKVVQTASVLGREFELRLLVQMLDNDDTVEPMVKQAEQSAIWSPLKELRYIFKHALLRDTVYQMQVRQQRQALHALAVTALESLSRDDMHPDYGELAYHALAADLGGKAFRYSVSAGDDALHKMALSDASSHYENAKQLLMDGRLTEIDTVDIQHLYLQSGRALELRNQFDQALEIYQQMIGQAELWGDERLKLASLTAQCIMRTTQTPLYDLLKARTLAEEALNLARELGDRATEAKVLWGKLLIEVWGEGDSRQGLAYGLRSLELARELGLKEQMGYTYQNLANAYMGLNQLVDARNAHQAAYEIWQELGNLPMLADASNMLHFHHVLAGELTESLSLAKEGLHLGQSIGNVWNQVVSLGFLANAYIELGDVGRATEMINKRARLTETVGAGFHVTYKYLVHFQRLSLALFLGVWDHVAQLGEELYENRHTLMPVFSRIIMAAVIRIKLAQGDLEQAQQIWEEISPGWHQEKPPNVVITPVIIAGLEILLAQKDFQQAFERAESLAELLLQVGGIFYLPEVLWLQGCACIAQKEWVLGHKALTQALVYSNSTGERRLRWRILASLAEIARAQGEEQAAERYSNEGRKVIDYITNTMDDDELRAAFLATTTVQQQLLG